MDDLTIEAETWGAFWPDARPLILQHKIELGQTDPRRRLVPDHQKIGLMESIRSILILAARANNRLVGYSIWYIMPSLETSGLMIAQQAPWYVLPEWRKRGIGMMLWREAKQRLKMAGARLLLAHAPPRGAGAELGKLFELEGGQLIENVYEIWLEN